MASWYPSSKRTISERAFWSWRWSSAICAAEAASVSPRSITRSCVRSWITVGCDASRDCDCERWNCSCCCCNVCCSCACCCWNICCWNCSCCFWYASCCAWYCCCCSARIAAAAATLSESLRPSVGGGGGIGGSISGCWYACFGGAWYCCCGGCGA